MNLRQLRYFAQTVEAGNITRAAEQLYVAQPALGLQIRQLEEELGVPLLIRHSRGVTATEAGKLLHDRAREVLRQIDSIKRDVMAHTSTAAESITLGLTPGLGKLFGAGLMVRVRDDMQGVSLSVVEEMSYVLIDAIERDEVHLALAYEVDDRPGLSRVPLFDEGLLFVTSDSSQTGPISLQDVLKQPLVLAGERDPIHQLVMQAGERLGVEPIIGFEASSVSIMKSLVVEGSAVSIMPYGSVIGELQRGELTGRQIEGGPLVRTLYLVHSSRRVPLIHEDALVELIKLHIRSALRKVEPMVNPREGLAAQPVD
jgi:LysR family transcriptional regulator, nitrogen assimilation regulatory protein